MSDFSSLAKSAKAWPFEEARKLLARTKGQVPEKGYVLFETGYGPSGLPHIGTFGEVARTSMVRNAFQALCPDVPTKLFCFSDDMDGFRKVPSNVPQQDMLAEFIGQPLTKVPDPFGKYESFAHHNNARLCHFLDEFGFDYEFLSSTDYYKGGQFDAALQRMLETYDQIMSIMLPTLGEERRATYSPFLPISPTTGKVLQVPMDELHPERGTIVFTDEDGSKVEVPVAGGQVKVQWKPDWAMRWYALGVDYEMSGKDLIDSVKQGAKITKALGGRAPEGFNYELFLDKEGAKISKSKGNGLSIEEWLTYAPAQSLSLYMFQKPRTAKRLYFDVIPRAMDEYLTFVEKFPGLEANKQIENPAWHIHSANVPARENGITFSLLLNLAAVVNSDDPAVLWGFISKYEPSANSDNAPLLNQMVGYAIRYYQDFVLPTKDYRAPTDQERSAMEALVAAFDALQDETDPEVIQTQVYAVGKEAEFENLRDWFQALYQVLLGQSQGPRFGSFAALYGVTNTQALIKDKLAGKGFE